MDATENEILDKMRQNANKGMKLLMDAYQERLYWHIRRLVVSHDDAQDLLQETFLRAYRSWDSFKRSSSIFSWLYRIATNLTLTYLRSMKEKNLLADANELQAEGYFEFGDNEVVALQNAIHALPPKQQAVFNMRYYDEMSFREIAIANDCTESSAKVNYHFAKSKIEDQMKNLFS